MSRFTLKRGATFAPTIAVTQSTGGPVQPLAGWTIESQVRTRWGELVSALTVENRNDAAGTYRLRAESTAAWPLDLLAWDIRYTRPDGTVLPTETVLFTVVARITQ